ncbi:unnamed protein product [Urochloa decumbens]|uniref:Protein FAR1-RELATED SEQUENCE n=1 Tax=Urochloa decumbens TaxID=240449 RepID=A0ABC9AXH8_9POAL
MQSLLRDVSAEASHGVEGFLVVNDQSDQHAQTGNDHPEVVLQSQAFADYSSDIDVGNGEPCEISSDDYADDEEEMLNEDEDDDEVVPGEVTIPTTIPEQNEQIDYEIIPTALGDCGCVSRSPGNKGRKRWPKGVLPPDCREARAMGTIEKAMRNSRHRTTSYIFEPVLGMVFDSRAEAYQFFNLYSWEVGFGIRFGSSARNRVNKYRTMQEIVCEKEGFDHRCKSSSKRSHCKAMLRLHRSQDHGWYVSRHHSEHNHPLSFSCGEKREWNSHSKIEQCVKDMIRYLRENNVSLSRVHCFLGSMFGSMEGVPFNQKTLRAVCAQIARDQKDDDVLKTLEVFRQMHEEDPGFQFSVALDADKKIQTLIWTSGRSKSQYNYFGDAVTFDTTYCTNLYKMPFGMFVGVNNHFQSVLFAGVLMRDEKTASFEWVFKEFLLLMGGKAPITILTDQCKAMTAAVRNVMKDTNHLWCKWHIFKDAPEELGPVFRWNGTFSREFHYVINQMLTEDEFERAWDDLLDRYELCEHPFMIRTYKKKKMWAKPWCKDIYCARMASTQRSESANSILKKVIPRNCSMNRFVEQYKKMLFLRAQAEEKEEHKTKQYDYRRKRVPAIEKHAISLYTRKAGNLFSEEVDKAADYNVTEGLEANEFRVVHNNEEVRKKWARVVFTVKIEDDGAKLVCECGLYQHFGMLCCHSIKVLIHFGAKKVPDAHIMKRWTRQAKDFEYPLESGSGSISNQLRKNVLAVNALEVAQTADKDPEYSDILMSHLSMAKKEIQRAKDEHIKNGQISGYSSTSGSDHGYSTDSGYETEPLSTNRYGASGSSAYMSDADILNIQAPPVPPKSSGRLRQNRFPRMFEYRRTRCSRKARFDDELYCDRCDVEGHDRRTCKLKVKINKKKKITTPVAAKRRNLTGKGKRSNPSGKAA